MKFFVIALLLIPPAFAQMTNVPCVPPPAPPPPANAASQGRVRGPRTPRPPPPPAAPVLAQNARLGPPPPQQPAADAAETPGLPSHPPGGRTPAVGVYSNGPAYPTAPELAKRPGV